MALLSCPCLTAIIWMQLSSNTEEYMAEIYVLAFGAVHNQATALMQVNIEKYAYISNTPM